MKKIQYPDDDEYIGEYKDIFSEEIEEMESQWKEILHENTLLNEFADDTVAKILTYKYNDLVDIYNKFIEVTTDIGEIERNNLNLRLKEVFNYSKWSGKIADYFMEHAEKFKITTCFYCDTAYINTYKYKTANKRHFDLDHALPKCKCPLVAISLFNFVPSCTVCNQRLKKTKLLGIDNIPSVKLSPSSSTFDVAANTTFEIRIKEAIEDSSIDRINPTKHPDDYEVVINSHMNVEDESFVEMFRLNERYEFHKTFALHWLEMKKKYNNSSIAMLSKVLDNTPFNVEQIKADIFQEDLDMEGKRCFSKLKKDILSD